MIRIRWRFERFRAIGGELGDEIQGEIERRRVELLSVAGNLRFGKAYDSKISSQISPHSATSVANSVSTVSAIMWPGVAGSSKSKPASG